MSLKTSAFFVLYRQKLLQKIFSGMNSFSKLAVRDAPIIVGFCDNQKPKRSLCESLKQPVAHALKPFVIVELIPKFCRASKNQDLKDCAMLCAKNKPRHFAGIN